MRVAPSQWRVPVEEEVDGEEEAVMRVAAVEISDRARTEAMDALLQIGGSAVRKPEGMEDNPSEGDMGDRLTKDHMSNHRRKDYTAEGEARRKADMVDRPRSGKRDGVIRILFH